MVANRAAIALAVTLLVSSEAQVFMGNGMGMAGLFFPLALTFVAVLHLLTLHAYDEMYNGKLGPGPTEYAFLTNVFGDWLPLVTSLASRFVFWLCAATVALVTAGFVFNEVFVYWFANFGFAFLLLTILLVLQFVGSRIALKVQSVLVIAALALLVVLVLAGMPHLPEFVSVNETSFQGRGLFLPFLMVVGVEFSFLGFSEEKEERPNLAQLFAVLSAVFLILILWGLVMASVVGPERLSGSFNPHMITARKVLGQPGRLIMGAALIAGTAALVNCLFIVLRNQFAEFLHPIATAENSKIRKWLCKAGIILLAVGPAIMMATGMAGEEGIDVFVRVALVFWLLHYSLVHFAVALSSEMRKWRHMLVGCVLVTASVFLGWSDPQPVVFFKSFAMIVLFAGAVGIFIVKSKRVIQGGIK